jgi:hypothetical protein
MGYYLLYGYAILSKIQYKLKKTEISDAEKDFETA